MTSTLVVVIVAALILFVIARGLFSRIAVITVIAGAALWIFAANDGDVDRALFVAKTEVTQASNWVIDTAKQAWN